MRNGFPLPLPPSPDRYERHYRNRGYYIEHFCTSTVHQYGPGDADPAWPQASKARGGEDEEEGEEDEYEDDEEEEDYEEEEDRGTVLFSMWEEHSGEAREAEADCCGCAWHALAPCARLRAAAGQCVGAADKSLHRSCLLNHLLHLPPARAHHRLPGPPDGGRAGAAQLGGAPVWAQVRMHCAWACSAMEGSGSHCALPAPAV